jgi:hypothetical protein
MKRNVTTFTSMTIAFLLLVSVAPVNGLSGIADQSPRSEFETRCGWLSNPSPGNIWLYDKDGEWTIGVQGGYQVQGDWDWPRFKRRQWVRTNVGSYGYGCACLELQVSRERHEVLEIKSARPRPLASCRQDPSLKRWKDVR